MAALREAGQIPDLRQAQIVRLKEHAEQKRRRIVALDAEIADLTGFKQLAISRLAAHHEEIPRLRRAPAVENIVDFATRRAQASAGGR